MHERRTPRKRHSPAVYRRRRIVLLLSLVVLAGLAWLLIAQPWRGSLADPASDPEPTSSRHRLPRATCPCREPRRRAPTPSATPTPEATAGAAHSATPSGSATPIAKPCVTRDVTVEAVTDQPTYASGQNPQLSIRLTNNGTADCTLNVGTSAQSSRSRAAATRGGGRRTARASRATWSCCSPPGRRSRAPRRWSWDRTRSSVGTCADADRPTAPGGGASYHLSVEIGGIASTESAQILLY